MGFTKEVITWYALRNPRPRAVLAHGRGIVGLLELGEATNVDSLRVGHT